MAIRIILADDHQIVRESFRALFENEPQCSIIADVADGAAAVKAALELKPDIVIMDMTMPILSGVEATQQILDQLPDTRIIALSMHTHPKAIAHMMKAGAVAFIPKTCKAKELIKAVLAVAQGKPYLAPVLENTVKPTSTKNETPLDDIPLAVLSPRENQILALIADGYETEAIANKIRISGKTVATHREHIMTKLKIDSVSGLTKYAIREGLSSI